MTSTEQLAQLQQQLQEKEKQIDTLHSLMVSGEQRGVEKCREEIDLLKAENEALKEDLIQVMQVGTFTAEYISDKMPLPDRLELANALKSNFEGRFIPKPAPDGQTI